MWSTGSIQDLSVKGINFCFSIDAKSVHLIEQCSRESSRDYLFYCALYFINGY